MTHAILRRCSLYAIGIYAAGSLLGWSAYAQSPAPNQEPPPNPDGIATRLESPDVLTRFAAAAELKWLPESAITPPLLGAVVRELHRVYQDPSAYIAALPANADTGEWMTEYVASLFMAAATSTDPIVIPALVESVGNGAGRPVFEALARFGPAAAGPLLQEIERRGNKDSSYASDALFALRVIVEKSGTLTQDQRDGMAKLAMRHLSGRQFPSTVEFAIDLAIALRDPQLTKAVTLLATSQSAADTGLILVGSNLPSRIDPFVRVRTHAASGIAKMNGVK
jgi:hypothetical protein